MTINLWILFAIFTALTMAFSSLRRCFRDTSQGHFHKGFSSWPKPLAEDFDEAEKLHRISALLDLIMHLLRISWSALWVVARIDAFMIAGASGWSVSYTGLLFVALELTVMSIVVLELFPQVVSSFRGKRIALGALPALFQVETVLSPVTKGFRGVRRTLLRIVGNGEEKSEADMAEEGILAAVEIGEREGLLHDREKTMIESMLEFHDAEVTEVMTPRTEMVCMKAALSIQDALPEIIDCGHSRIPVYEENIDNMVGVLYVKDLLRHAKGGASNETPLANVVRKVYFVPETKKIGELLGEFRSQRFHIAVILDEYGGTAGLVTIEDILEEIVGEIEDEHDPTAVQLISKVDDVTFDIDGRAHIDDVNDMLSVDIPESDDYETVAGFIFGTVGKVPATGDLIEHNGLRFHITSADERKIKRLRVHVVERHEEDVDA